MTVDEARITLVDGKYTVPVTIGGKDASVKVHMWALGNDSIWYDMGETDQNSHSLSIPLGDKFSAGSTHVLAVIYPGTPNSNNKKITFTLPAAAEVRSDATEVYQPRGILIDQTATDYDPGETRYGLVNKDSLTGITGDIYLKNSVNQRPVDWSASIRGQIMVIDLGDAYQSDKVHNGQTVDFQVCRLSGGSEEVLAKYHVTFDVTEAESGAAAEVTEEGTPARRTVTKKTTKKNADE